MPLQYVARYATRINTNTMFRHYCDGTITTVPLGTGGFSRESYERTKQWDRTPNFRVLKSQGKHLPDQSFLWKESRINDTGILFKYHEALSACSGNPSTEPFRKYEELFHTIYWVHDKGTRYLSENACRAKLIDRAKGAEWSTPVFVGEGRQTVNLVVNAARTIGSAYRDLRRGNFGGALAQLGIQGDRRALQRYNRQYGRDPSGAAANAWLSLTYGWTPLLGDVVNAAETLAETLTREENREIRVTAVTRFRSDNVTPNVSIATSPQIHGRKTLSQQESCRGVWRCKPTSWDTAGSFGLLNPASVAWELVPLSFVVDWFLPIGRYLEGLDVPIRFQHLGGTIGYRRETHHYYDTFLYYGQPQSGGDVYHSVYTEVVRTPLTGHPTVGIDSIVFEPKLGSSRIASALSLLRQTMRR